METTCYCAAVRTAARKTTALYDSILEPAGVTLAQFSLLRKIKRAGTVSLTGLGRLADLDRSTIGRNVKALEKLRLVSVGLGGGPPRGRGAAHASKASARCDVGAPLWDEAQRRVEAALGATGASQLQTLAHNL